LTLLWHSVTIIFLLALLYWFADFPPNWNFWPSRGSGVQFFIKLASTLVEYMLPNYSIDIPGSIPAGNYIFVTECCRGLLIEEQRSCNGGGGQYPILFFLMILNRRARLNPTSYIDSIYCKICIISGKFVCAWFQGNFVFFFGWARVLSSNGCNYNPPFPFQSTSKQD